MHEYEVELKLSSALLGLPDRTHDIRPDNETSHEDCADDVNRLIESPQTPIATANEASRVSE